MTANNPIAKYIDRIKNDGKRKYAAAYYHYLRGLYAKPEPEEYGIQYMTAHFVREQLLNILKGSK